jgi:hypothetical protein
MIQVDNDGQVSVVSGSWWFAVVAVPLTVVTFLVWKLWLNYATKSQEHKERKQNAIAGAEYHSRNRQRRVGLGWASGWLTKRLLTMRRKPDRLAENGCQV